jgi:N-acetylmuramoyl-L-alanine amidase
MKATLVALLVVTGCLAAAQKGRSELLVVQGVRHWTSAGATRVAIEVSGEFTFRTERLHNPERVFFDFPNSRPHPENRRQLNKDLEGKLLKKIRMAETQPGVTRVVLDLRTKVDLSISKLSNPNRLVVEMKPASGSGSQPMPDPPASTPTPVLAKPPEAVVSKASNAPAAPPAVAPKPSSAAPVEKEKEKPTAEAAAETPADPGRTGAAARRTSNGNSSLTRALGLKINRVVIDPGHGGHDHGTSGSKGLLEKELVLDVSLRLGRLIQSRLGAEVFYTRTTDTFVPLETRTAIANEKKADLFLSIHANSSPLPRIAGVETYYLNFTDSRDALDVASRENASSQKSVFELRDLIQKITLHEKIEESKEFATRVQASLYSFSSRSVQGTKNRGVKKAPFIVLIGANMPSVLAEIGFLSNAREEALLKRPDHRDKLAEALFKGVSRYAEGLSHFQVAAAERESKASGQGK